LKKTKIWSKNQKIEKNKNSDQKPKKREKTKIWTKNQKNVEKNQNLDQKPKKHRENQKNKNKKNNISELLDWAVDLESSEILFFLFLFFFLDVFLVFGPNFCFFSRFFVDFWSEFPFFFRCSFGFSVFILASNFRLLVLFE